MTGIPDKGPVTVPAGRIEKEMQTRDSMLWSRIALKLVAGVPLTLIVPFVGATLASVLVWWAGFYSWVLWFILIGGAWGWLAYRYLKTHHEKSVFAEAMIREIGGDEAARTNLREEWEIKREEGTASAYLDVALYGPREVLEAWELVQERRHFAPSARQRCIEIVQYLLKFDRGVPWIEMLQEGEDIANLLHAMGYLRITDWIDLSSDKKKAWLLSQARRAMLST